MAHRDEGELGLIMSHMRRRQFVRWRDWGLFLLAVGFAVAVAVI